MASLKSKKSDTVNVAITAALLAAKTIKQSFEQFEMRVHTASLSCVAHFEKCGDAMPADRLVKGLRDLNHPALTRTAAELVAWFKTVSPIRWDMNGKVMVLKEGDDGYKAPDVEAGEKTPFNETAAAKKARSKDAQNTREILKPLTLADIMGRAKGLRRTVEAATKPDAQGHVRGVNEKDKAKIDMFLTGLDGFVAAFGTEPKVEAKVESKTRSKKAA